MSGGTAAVNYPQGKVASVTLTADFISTATAVTKVVLQNLDLDAEIASLSSFLPSMVEHIELDNTLLSDFPAGLGDLTSLQQLYVVVYCLYWYGGTARSLFTCIVFYA